MPTTAARPTTTTSTATTTASSTSPPLATWPPGRRAWTVVLATAPSRAAAERRARELVARGVKAGVLDTSKFDVAASGAFVVFRGRFPSQAAAVAEETRLQREAPPSAFVAEVSPR